MCRNLKLYLSDILKSIDKIQKSTKNVDKKYLIEHEIVFDGIVLNLQVIGESVKQIPPRIREKSPHIPWRDIIGLRNIISHAYYLIDIDIIWDIIQTEIPPLKTAIEQIQASEPSD